MELRTFEYDTSPFPKCVWGSPSSKYESSFKLRIRKYQRKDKRSNMGLEEVPKGAFRFRTSKIPTGNMYIDCHPGFIDKPVIARDSIVRKIQGCGIGTILIKLCMNEKKIHNAKRNRKNTALKSLGPKFKKTMNWMKSHCSKVVMLKMDKPVASMFFKSAKLFGFSIVVIKRWVKTSTEELYPHAAPCNIHEIATNYKNGRMDIDGRSVMVTGKDHEWYFCLPTKTTATKIPKCK